TFKKFSDKTGISVKATITELIKVTATTTVNTITIFPTSSSIKTIGINTTIVVNAEEITAPASSFVPVSTASVGLKPCSFFWKIDYYTTIATSTIITNPSSKPIKQNKLKL